MKHNPALLIFYITSPKLNYDNVQQQQLLTVVRRHKAKGLYSAENNIRNDIYVGG